MRPLDGQSIRPFAEYDPATIIGVMSTIGLVVPHREEFEEFDEQVQNLLIPTLAAGLTAE